MLAGSCLFLLPAAVAVAGAGAPDPIVFSPIGLTRDEATPWEKWQRTATQETSNHGDVYMGHQHHGFPQSIQKSQNGNIYRIEVRQGEGRDRDRDHRNDRAELGTIKRYPYGNDIWVAYSLKVESQPLLHEHERVVISQFHGHDGSPAMSLRLNHGKLGIQSLSNTSIDPATRRALKTDHLDTTIEFDRWHAIVIRANFGTRQNARLQVWLDGELLLDRDNFEMGYTTGTQVYWKFGVYRNTHPGVHALQFANMEISQSSLLERVKDPRRIIP
jgi:hypothetical protein